MTPSESERSVTAYRDFRFREPVLDSPSALAIARDRPTGRFVISDRAQSFSSASCSISSSSSSCGGGGGGGIMGFSRIFRTIALAIATKSFPSENGVVGWESFGGTGGWEGDGASRETGGRDDAEAGVGTGSGLRILLYSRYCQNWGSQPQIEINERVQLRLRIVDALSSSTTPSDFSHWFSREDCEGLW